MDAESSLHWLRTTDLERAETAQILQALDLVQEALETEVDEAPDEEAAQSGLEMLEALHEVQARLQDGPGLSELKTFLSDFAPPPAPLEAPEVILERELREIAAGIGPEKWNTESYQMLESAIETLHQDDDEESFWAVITTLASNLEQARETYHSTDILPKEVTVESVVLHKLLCEGVDQWLAALGHLDEAEEIDWDGVLETAELGNRLLIAVQVYFDRLRRAVTMSPS